MTVESSSGGPPLVDITALREELLRVRERLEDASRRVGVAETRALRAERVADRLRSSRALRLAELRHALRKDANPFKVLVEAWRIIRGTEAKSLAKAVAALSSPPPVETASPAIQDLPTAAPAPAPINPIAALRQALRTKEYDAAMSVIEAAEGTYREHPDFLKLRRDVLIRRGALSDALDVTRDLARVTRSQEFRRDQRFMTGRLLETDAAWSPRIPGPPSPMDPISSNTVLHLLKESVPYHNNGFCMRSHYSLLSMKAAGIAPYVITSPGFPYRDGVVDFPQVEVIDEIPHYRIDLGYPEPARVPYDDYLRDYAWAAAKLAQKIRPAIIHAGSGYRGYESALVGLALRDHFRLPLVYEVRSFFETTWTADMAWAERGEHFHRRFATENRCMRAADVVITIAEAMRDEIVERGVDPDRIFVIPNGVDSEVFSPRERDRDLASQYAADGVPTFGYVSNLDHMRENQELLIEATAVLKERGRLAKCMIVGDGRRRDELENLARDRGVAREVTFTGKVPHAQIQDYYALLDVFVVPRTAERASRLVTPLKPYEAMAMGVPCVVSELPALLEITGNGTRGLSFPPDDAGRLADMLEYMFDNPEIRQQLGEHAREWVTHERSWLANGKRYADAYGHALTLRKA